MTSDKVEQPRATEAQITAAVIAHWRARAVPGSLVASIPNMGARGQYGLTAGLPDLLVIAKGLPVGFIELKTERGKLSAAQLTIKDICLTAGVNHCVTYGLEQALDVLEGWRVIKPVARSAS